MDTIHAADAARPHAVPRPWTETAMTSPYTNPGTRTVDGKTSSIQSGRHTVPPLDGILETALYVDDLAVARDFYETVMALSAIVSDERMVAFAVGEDRVLLLFKRGESAVEVELPGGTIPPHDGGGALHIAFAVADTDLVAWEARLNELGIEIEARVDWSASRHSLYFRDPDGHLLELASRRLWAHK
jgi:catechol 2,3-dioxygenase-like lactoylglutathione lyase family enzyme